MLLRWFFARVGRLARRRAESHFDSVFTSRIEVRHFRALVKNHRKIVPDMLLMRVARQIACESRFVRVWRPQNCPQELSGAPWNASWGDSGALLGALGSLLGRSWGVLGRSWDALKRSWDALGRLLGATWENRKRNTFFCHQLGPQNGAKLGPKYSTN